MTEKRECGTCRWEDATYEEWVLYCKRCRNRVVDDIDNWQSKEEQDERSRYPH